MHSLHIEVNKAMQWYPRSQDVILEEATVCTSSHLNRETKDSCSVLKLSYIERLFKVEIKILYMDPLHDASSYSYSQCIHLHRLD